MDRNKLKGFIAERGLSQVKLAQMVGMSLSSLNRKLKNGKFTLGEIQKIGEALGMSEREITEVFLR